MLASGRKTFCFLSLILFVFLFSGCDSGSSQPSAQQQSAPLPSQKTDSTGPAPSTETQATAPVQPSTTGPVPSAPVQPQPSPIVAEPVVSPPPAETIVSAPVTSPSQPVSDPVVALPQHQTTSPTSSPTEEVQTLTLLWDPLNDPAVQGYKVHTGNASGQYDMHQDVGKTTSFVAHVSGGYTWYFAVSAYNTAGDSPLSQELSTAQR